MKKVHISSSSLQLNCEPAIILVLQLGIRMKRLRNTVVCNAALLMDDFHALWSLAKHKHKRNAALACEFVVINYFAVTVTLNATKRTRIEVAERRVLAVMRYLYVNNIISKRPEMVILLTCCKY